MKHRTREADARCSYTRLTRLVAERRQPGWASVSKVNHYNKARFHHPSGLALCSSANLGIVTDLDLGGPRPLHLRLNLAALILIV